MVKRLFFLAAMVVSVFAAAHCNSDDDVITGPPIVTVTPSPGPGTPTVTPGGATTTPTMTPTTGGGSPTPTVTPNAAIATVDVGLGGDVFVDRVSGTSTTTIPVGGTVHWTWAESEAHSTTSGTCTVACTPDGTWDSQIQTGGTFDHIFPVAGTFPYFCAVHGAMMTGTVVVQ